MNKAASLNKAAISLWYTNALLGDPYIALYFILKVFRLSCS